MSDQEIVAAMLRMLKSDESYKQGFLAGWRQCIAVMQDVVESKKGLELVALLDNKEVIPPQVRLAGGVHEPVEVNE